MKYLKRLGLSALVALLVVLPFGVAASSYTQSQPATAVTVASDPVPDPPLPPVMVRPGNKLICSVPSDSLNPVCQPGADGICTNCGFGPGSAVKLMSAQSTLTQGDPNPLPPPLLLPNGNLLCAVPFPGGVGTGPYEPNCTPGANGIYTKCNYSASDARGTSL